MIPSIALNTVSRIPLPPPATLQGAQSVLVVEAPGALRLLERNPSRQHVVLTQLRMLNPRMLSQVAPDAVVGPLIADGWDSLDLAIALEEMGYRKTLCILSRPLPHAELVLREVRAYCPSLEIVMVETP